MDLKPRALVYKTLYRDLDYIFKHRPKKALAIMRSALNQARQARAAIIQKVACDPDTEDVS